MKHSKRWKGRKIRRRACRLAAGFGCRQRVPSAGPEAGPMPNFFMQFMQQVQQPGGGRHDAGPVQQNQQPVPIMQEQIYPEIRVFRYPPGRNMPEVPVSSAMLPRNDMGGMPLLDDGIPEPVPIIALLRTVLANASPEHQRLMLGENLYPLVDAIEPEYSCKVTGMLLELDKDEVLHLIESPDALKARVADALESLRNAGWHC